MKICAGHWKEMREAIDHRGLAPLVHQGGEAAMEAEIRQLEEAKRTGTVSNKTLRDTFDPLMSMHWHFTNEALRCGGLYLLGQREDGGNYCPVCEFEAHQPGFDAKEQIGMVADQMRKYCIEQGLVAKEQ